MTGHVATEPRWNFPNSARTALAFAAVATLAAAVPTGAAAGALEDGRTAIIHTSQSTIMENNGTPRTELLSNLEKAGVKVVGRYLGRCRQGLPGKNLWRKLIKYGGAEGKEYQEAETILDAGFAIISIYQYNAFDDKKFTRGLREKQRESCEDTDAAREIANRKDPKNRISMSATDEGRLDAQAAVKQAHAMKQPPGTAIYFGVDYNFNTGNAAQVKGVQDYFTEIREELRKQDNGYLVGAYGNGDVLGLLSKRDADNQALIDFAWISPSRSYRGTPEFHNGGKWNLLQSQPDNTIALTDTGQCFEFEYDANVQNKNAAPDQYAGAWNRAGRYTVPQAVTEAVYDQRRFVCNIKGVAPEPTLGKCRSVPQRRTCGSNDSCIDWVVRVKPTGPVNGPQLSIDFHDYGRFEGSSPATSLSRSLTIKPSWDDGERAKKNCTCFGSDESQPCKPK